MKKMKRNQMKKNQKLSSNLRSLTLNMHCRITKDGVMSAVSKLPLLEELEITHGASLLDLKAIGQSCPRLKTLKLNFFRYFCSPDDEDDDYDALAIAETMHELRHLQLHWNRVTDLGLIAILDNCPHLQHLDLRKCSNVNKIYDLPECVTKIRISGYPNFS